MLISRTRPHLGTDSPKTARLCRALARHYGCPALGCESCGRRVLVQFDLVHLSCCGNKCLSRTCIGSFQASDEFLYSVDVSGGRKRDVCESPPNGIKKPSSTSPLHRLEVANSLFDGSVSFKFSSQIPVKSANDERETLTIHG